MRQVFCVRSVNAPSASVVNYTRPTQPMAFGAAPEYPCPWPCAGTFTNLVVHLTTAPGAAASGKRFVVTLRKNLIDTALTCTISETATSAWDITHSVSMAAGDLLSLAITPTGTPTLPGDVFVTIEFEGTTTAESGYSWAVSGTSTTATRWQSVFGGSASYGTTSGALMQSLAAVAGTLSAMYVLTATAPGGTDTRTYTLYKNGVKQDGTGGTVDTAITLTGAATSGNKTFSLAVVPGDFLYLEATVLNTPAASTVDALGFRFVATTDGESQYCGWYTDNPNTGGSSNFYSPIGVSLSNSTFEALGRVYAGVTPFTLTGLSVNLTGDPGIGNNYTFRLRKNGADAAGGPEVLVADAATSGSTPSGSVALVDGDLFCVRSFGVSAPTSRQGQYSTKQTMTGGEAPIPKGIGTQISLEVAAQSSVVLAQITQVPVEAVTQSSVVRAQIFQIVVEAIYPFTCVPIPEPTVPLATPLPPSGKIHYYGYTFRRTMPEVGEALGLAPGARLDLTLGGQAEAQLLGVKLESSQPLGNPFVADRDGYFSTYVVPAPIDHQIQDADVPRYTLLDAVVLDPRVGDLAQRVAALILARQGG